MKKVFALSLVCALFLPIYGGEVMCGTELMGPADCFGSGGDDDFACESAIAEGKSIEQKMILAENMLASLVSYLTVNQSFVLRSNPVKLITLSKVKEELKKKGTLHDWLRAHFPLLQKRNDLLEPLVAQLIMRSEMQTALTDYQATYAAAQKARDYYKFFYNPMSLLLASAKEQQIIVPQEVQDCFQKLEHLDRSNSQHFLKIQHNVEVTQQIAQLIDRQQKSWIDLLNQTPDAPSFEEALRVLLAIHETYIEQSNHIQ